MLQAHPMSRKCASKFGIAPGHACRLDGASLEMSNEGPGRLGGSQTAPGRSLRHGFGRWRPPPPPRAQGPGLPVLPALRGSVRLKTGAPPVFHVASYVLSCLTAAVLPPSADARSHPRGNARGGEAHPQATTRRLQKFEGLKQRLKTE